MAETSTRKRARKERPRKICVVTGSRADFGLLRAVMAAIKRDPAFTLQVIASAMHLAPQFGLTYREIESEGFHIDAKVDFLLHGDTPLKIAQSMGFGTSALAEAYSQIRPDIIMLLGDRFEALAAASAALVMGIPIVHLSGGDITEGAFDDAIRHAISKMSHLHFVASPEAAARVRQMGEDPRRVHVVGDPGLDSLRRISFLGRKQLERDLGFKLRKRNLLVTFHPVTIGRVPSTRQFAVLLEALDTLGPEFGLIFTKPNADPEGLSLMEMLERYVAAHENAVAHASLGYRRYLSVMAQCDAVVGNSSSGLVEAPSLGKPTVNVGSRQDGRLKARSVIDCPVEQSAIRAAIGKALKMRLGRVKNPYGDGHAAGRILRVLKKIDDPEVLLHKKFHELSAHD